MSGPGRRKAKGAAVATANDVSLPVAISTKVAGRLDRWSDTLSFVLAVTGAAIGFKTIWQFPHLASQNGGGAFVLIYFLLAYVVGSPLLIALVMLGRRTRMSPVSALADLSVGVRGGRYWSIAGWLAMVGGFIVFSYLSVIAGWTLGYFVRALFGAFTGLTADGLESVFVALVKDPEKQIFWYSVFVATTTAIVAGGVRDSIEPAIKFLVPLLYAMLLSLAIYAVRAGGFADAVSYLFTPDFNKLTPMTWLAAAAQVFFSLGLGTGMALMYGAYIKPDTSIPRAAMTVIGLDALTSIAAALVIFAILFGGGVASASGPSLVFQSLPLAFDHLPLGRWFASLFFGLMVIIALLTAIGLIEPAIVWLEERFSLSRRNAAVMCGASAWTLGLASLFAFNYGAFSFRFFGVDRNLGAFDVLQILSAEVMLPCAGLVMALFAGWMLSPDSARADLQMRSPCSFDAWLWLLRIVVPVLIVVLLFSLSKL